MLGYQDKGQLSVAEKEDFVMSFLDRLMEQVSGKPFTIPAKEIVVAFFEKGESEGPISPMSLLDYVNHVRLGTIHGMSAGFLLGESVHTPPLPKPKEGGVCLLSDFFIVMLEESKKDKGLGVDYCRAFMSLLCNLINPEPKCVDDAQRLVNLLEMKLASFMFGNENIANLKSGEVSHTDVVRKGKRVLDYLAQGGVVPTEDIVVMVMDPVTGKTICDCHEMVTLLLSMRQEGKFGVNVMGGLAPYDDLKKHDYICLSDFVMVICTWPEPTNVAEGTPHWSVLSNFVTMLIYGTKGAQDEDNNIDTFNRLMACQKTIKKQKLN